MTIKLPSLPYAHDALSPYISRRTLDFHHGKHHRAYVDNLNRLILGRPEENAPLESIITNAAGDSDKIGIFNNAAQVWNHTFYWKSMKPLGGGVPHGAVGDAIARDFDGFDGFKEAFAKVARTQFGSGWAWLVAQDGKLSVISTANAELPSTKLCKRNPGVLVALTPP